MKSLKQSELESMMMEMLQEKSIPKFNSTHPLLKIHQREHSLPEG